MQCFADYHLQRKQASLEGETSLEVCPSRQFSWGQVCAVKLIMRLAASNSQFETIKDLHLDVIHQPNFATKDLKRLSVKM